MLTISRKEIQNSYLIDLLARRHVLYAKINAFEKQYGASFDAFEQKIKKKDENFAEWDDYIEWKAYKEAYNDIEKRIEDVKNGNFEIS
ncbi:MAG: hypothetical protein GF401_17245 [Chitinivibrionales bacterium]|nr:hypothetical protein [Chitinivibrionales bacterium]